MYLELLAKTLTNSIYEDRLPSASEVEINTLEEVLAELKCDNVSFNISAKELAQILQYTKKSRNVHTFVSERALRNIADCIEAVKASGVQGDVIDCGVLRGGTSIFMAGVLKHHGMDRKLYVADSFQGLPAPSAKESTFAREFWYKYADRLSEYNLSCFASKADVISNFEKYNLISHGVIFLEGWFAETLSSLPVSTQFSLIRIDADWYQSTLDALSHTYPYLSTGGYVIVDDYLLEGCKQAVDEYRSVHDITSPIEIADERNGVVFWQKK
ncbi:TylF/MycF/NovP-related O-methyltransferase [Pseudomonas viridiflava]|uniref:TylF/MycF/NovP-related O-methyltransferase n=1 Tax=Pseudomonas viridiflava TaxID=33069 RepID=UPI000F030EFA|nr:TylF/MycF/NovP-related O-methyltransferase [Pseudomonas viridiflava]MEE4106756.1 TylF/MycF/NovP-related O-methyltransferase [Pseudomonas viridiflava]QXG49827.1 TylF/MycF family methyltransferase [Pseudomonas viridiflava]